MNPHCAFGRLSLAADLLQGGVWIGFHDGGVAYFRDGQVRSYTAADIGVIQALLTRL